MLRGTAAPRAVVVCGPVGSGKTIAARHYVSRAQGAAAYCRLTATVSLDALDRMLADAMSSAEVAIDDLDAAPIDVVDALVERIAEGSDSRRFLLLGRSRSRMRAHRLLASGIADLLDASTLAFSREEVAQLAAELGAQFDDETVVQLTHDTDGWATPVAWILREAAITGRSLRATFAHWTERCAHLVLELLAHAHERDGESFAAFKAQLHSAPGEAQTELREYEALGFPVIRTRTSFRAYRLLSRLLRSEAAPAERASAPPLMTVGAFASFRCEIGGRPLAFRRRRDRNILAYVALAPEGRVTRKELLDTFWPGADRTVATQSLRTAISRIRVAVAEIAGTGSVDDYVRSSDGVCLNFDNVSFDVRRFVENVRHGDIELARQSVESAERHYAAAERLYRGRLLSAEAVEPCFGAIADELERLYLETLVRRVRMYAAAGDIGNARSCARKVLERARDEGFRSRVMALLDAQRYAPA